MADRTTEIAEAEVDPTIVSADPALLRRIVDTFPAPLSAANLATGKILFENRAVGALFGGATPQKRDGGDDAARWADAEDRAAFLGELAETGSVEALSARLRKEDGTGFWCAVSARVVEHKGERIAVTGFVDLTERYAAEEKLEQQRALLHQSEKLSALGALLAGISHELNNPISVLVGQAQLLKEKATDMQTVARAERIGEAAERCARIVKSFLTLARQKPKEEAHVDLNEVVGKALELTAQTLRLSSIEVTLDLGRALPPVPGDVDQLRQLILNLIVNARHALEETEGPRALTVATALGTDGTSVRTTVTDNGPGIPKDAASRIFEPLFTTKDVGKGTGLGLALCHRIAASHGGSIRLEKSSPGETRFAVSLPALDTAPAEAPMRVFVKTDPTKQRIMIVTDADDIHAASKMLIEAGHGVDLLGSAAAAFERLKALSHDLLFCDARYPDLDPMAFCRSVQEARPGFVERLVFIVDASLGRDTERGLEATGRPFLEARFARKEVEDIVDLLVRRPMR